MEKRAYNFLFIYMKFQLVWKKYNNSTKRKKINLFKGYFCCKEVGLIRVFFVTT